MIKRILLLIFLLTIACTAHAQYNTNFPSPPAPENPISEGGEWINGRTNGTSWGNVITDSHGAHGEPQAQQSAFADYTAILTGAWSSGQTACGTVYIDPTLTRTSSNYEIEVRTNVTVASGNITGYEFNYSMDNNGNQYWGAVRWNGAVGNFTGFTGFSSPTALANGDVLCGSHISGTLTITLTRSGTVIQSQSVPDTQQGGATYTGGAPGMGFFNGGGPVTDNAKFGFSAWNTTTSGGGGGGGNTYTASSCGQGDVNEVINGSGGTTAPIVPHNAIDGDTILIPAGSCTWTSSITVPTGKRISIIGSGTPNTLPSQYGIALSAITTHITHGGFVMTPIYDASNYLSRISLIDFEPATGAGAPIVVTGSCTTSGCPSLRLDNLYFPTSWSTLALSDAAVAVIADMFGVADHNTAGDGPPTVNYLAFINLGHGTWLSSTSGNGDLSWASPPSVGTPLAFYLENNTLNYALGTDTDIPSGNIHGGGARLVCRFNDAVAINDFGICSGHGTDTTGRPRGVMQWEGYYNIGVCPAWPNGIECNSAWPARSGWGYSFGNAITNGTGTFTSMTGFENQRTWRGSSPWGECDGQSPWDTNDGVTYFAGTVGSFTEIGTGSGNWLMTVSGTSPGWSFNQWVAYTFFDDTHGTATMVQTSGANTLTTVNVCDTCIGWQTGGNPPLAGDTFHIYRSKVCMDQANRGAGVQLNGNYSNPAPVGPVNEVLQPSYQGADSVPSTVGSNMGSQTPNMVANNDFYMEVPNQGPQTSNTFPFTGIKFSQPIQSWTCSGGTGHCIVTVASTTGLVANGPVINAGSTPGAHKTVDGSYTIIGTPTGTTYTINNVGDYTDSAGAGGTANGAGVGHGTLALRPTTCSPGVGYWATDQGTWNTVSGTTQKGELFICGASGWPSSPSYQPYTYPHPLVSAIATVSISPPSENFGSSLVGNSTAPQTATLTNGTAASITISSVTTTGNSADFPNTANTCTNGFVVTASGGTCSVSTKFDPTVVGSRSATLTITTSAGSFSVALSGIGGSNTTNPPSCTPTSGVVPQTVTCTNPNSGTTIMCYAASPITPATNGSGTACSSGTAYTTQLAISSAETLEVIAGVAGQSDSAISSYTYTAAAPNCPSPTSIGQFTFCSEAYNDVNGTSVSVSLSPYAGNGVELFVSFCGPACNAAPPAVTLTISDNINNPETCFVKSPHSPFSLANTSVPDYETLYALYCPSIPSGVTSLTATASTTLGALQLDAIEWKVGAIASSNYFENVDNFTGSGAVTGTTATVVTSGPTVSPNDLVTSMIANCGLVSASVGTGYTGIIVNPSATPGHIVEAKAVTSIQSPDAVATMSWSSGTPLGNCGLGQPAPNDTWFGIIVPLVGAQVSITPASINFGSQTVGVTSAGKLSTVVNNTASAITVSTISYGTPGSNPLDFSTSSTTCSGTVPANGGSCTVTTVFKPSVSGLETATLNFAFTGASGSPLTVSLSGTGGAPQVASCMETQTTNPIVAINVGRHVSETESGSTNDSAQAVKPSGVCHAIP